MTIINLASDGLHSQMIVLARVVAKCGPLDRDELLSVCSVPSGTGEGREIGRLRAVLTRWTEIGLFLVDGGSISLSEPIKKGETLDAFTDRLPAVCRRLILNASHSLPLWGHAQDTMQEPSEEGTGRVADLARSLSWSLAQNIYQLPNGDKEIQQLVGSQVPLPRFIFLNSTRWPGMRVWARYLGFASGEDRFLLDPTEAIRSELKLILTDDQSIKANDFIDELSHRIPVLDRGVYRVEVESYLRPESWRRPDENHLSMSLSMAIRRLELSGVIVLETKSDSEASIALTGRGYRTWNRFTHVRMAESNL